jgi:hypothetical protein
MQYKKNEVLALRGDSLEDLALKFHVDLSTAADEADLAKKTWDKIPSFMQHKEPSTDEKILATLANLPNQLAAALRPQPVSRREQQQDTRRQDRPQRTEKTETRREPEPVQKLTKKQLKDLGFSKAKAEKWAGKLTEDEAMDLLEDIQEAEPVKKVEIKKAELKEPAPYTLKELTEEKHLSPAQAKMMLAANLTRAEMDELLEENEPEKEPVVKLEPIVRTPKQKLDIINELTGVHKVPVEQAKLWVELGLSNDEIQGILDNMKKQAAQAAEKTPVDALTKDVKKAEEPEKPAGKSLVQSADEWRKKHGLTF